MRFGSNIRIGRSRTNNESFESIYGSQLVWSLNPADVTLGTTMFASGTTPPAVTLSTHSGGTLRQGTEWLLKIKVAGGLGTARFNASPDGGVTWTIVGALTAATYDLPDGIRLNFANSTYSTDNQYSVTVATLHDVAGVRNFTTATAANQWLWRNADLTHGQPYITPQAATTSRLDGTYTRSAPATQNMTFFGILRQRGSISGRFALGDSAMYLQQSGASPNMRVASSTNSSVSAGAPLDTWVLFELELTGSASSRFKLGSATDVTGNFGNVGGNSPYLGGGLGVGANCEWAYYAAITGIPTTNQLNRTRLLAQERWLAVTG